MSAQPFMLEGPPGPNVVFEGKKYLYFAGTSYYSLQSDPRLIEAANQASLRYGTGSASSRSLAGTTSLLLDIEREIAGFFHTEDAAFLPSGYLGNLAGLQALSELNLYNVIFLDEHSHYSLSDGAHGSGLPVVTFRHRSIEDLELKLTKASENKLKPLIATDGLFPVLGELPPLDQYLALAEKHNGLIWIDDAHGIGILGEHGRGSYEHFRLNSPRLYMSGTLSKAFGAYGGIIPGDRQFITSLRKGKVLTGSSPPMNAAIGAGLKGLELVKEHPEMRDRLRSNARSLKAGFRALGIPVQENSLPIVAFKPGEATQMIALQSKLIQDGIFIQYARYQGAGPDGILRIVVFSNHTEEQIEALLTSLKKHLPGTASHT